jgi:hypothetical protein
MIALVFLGVAAVVWFAAPSLARAMFARPDRDVPFALSTRGVPALACFVTGLVVLAAAVPSGITWGALLVMQRTMTGSVFDSRMADVVDQRTVATGAELVARIAVGVALLALSRRPDFWPIPDVAAATPIDESEPPPA